MPTIREKTEVSESGTARRKVDEQIVELVSDSGEGAQKAGQSFGTVSAKMGNGVWTVEIIPAEIKPPARSRAGASGIRIRFGSKTITNVGDEADLVVAFNEQVLYGRIAQGAFRRGTVVLLENKWVDAPDERVREEYESALVDFAEFGLEIIPVAFETECQKIIAGTRVGKNMFVLGVLCQIYGRDLAKAEEEIRLLFGRKGEAVVDANTRLVRGGYEFAGEQLGHLRFEVPASPAEGPRVVMNGNQAVGLGIMASGMEVVAMYPITPATSVSHYLADAFPRVGGIVHQAEDEIAAIGFALGASYAGNAACTVTSGPGWALKTEFLGLAVMAEIPLVIVLVQRGGPSTGLPTKVEQGDLLAALYGAPGDAPKVVLAPATIEECFHFMVMARKLAEDFRTPVVVMTDANLAAGVQPFPRPELRLEWFARAYDQQAWPEGMDPYDWDPESGLSPRPIPGQPGGEYTVTGLAHTRKGKVAYDPDANQIGCEMRSRKLATLAATLKPPEVFGEPEGDLLVVAWGSTLGAIREAVEMMRFHGHSVSAMHLRFLSPLEPGLREIMSGFRRVMTVEINYSDPDTNGSPAASGTPQKRRAQLARLLRDETLVDVDSWSVVCGHPLAPKEIARQLEQHLPGAKE